MAADDEIFATPMMQLVPGLVAVPEGALDTMGEMQGVVIGWQQSRLGPILYVGTRAKDGAAQIAAVPEKFWGQLYTTLCNNMAEASEANEKETAN